MILQFKTKRNVNGNRKFLAIDTSTNCYTRVCRWMITEGVEITAKAYKEILEQLEAAEFEEKEEAF